MEQEQGQEVEIMPDQERVHYQEHAERVYQPHAHATEQQITANRRGLLVALLKLRAMGNRWVCDPAQMVGRVVHERRDQVVFGVVGVGTAPIIAHDIAVKVLS